MTDESTPAPASAQPAPPPQLEDVGKLSANQADIWLKDLSRRVEWADKLLRNDVGARKLFDALVQRRFEAEDVDQIVLDADAPLPVPGGPNVNGLSARDVKSGVQSLLDDGLSTGAVVELLRNQAVVSPADYRVIAREFSERCLNNPIWKAALLAGDPTAKRQLLAWGTIKLTSRPLPESPRFDVVK